MQVNQQSVIRFFNAADGLVIRYGIWPCNHVTPAGTVILLNGRREFIEKYFEIVNELHEKGYAVYTIDWRGQGLSGRLLPDRRKGHIDDYANYLSDLDLFINKIVSASAPPPHIFLAHSLGAHIALRYLHKQKNTIQKVVLTAAMLDIQTRPYPKKLVRCAAHCINAAGWGHRYAPGASHYHPEHLHFENNRLTSDPERFNYQRDSIKRNPNLDVGGPTWGWLSATFNSIDVLKRPGYLESIEQSTLLVSAENDGIVSNRAQRLAAGRMPACRHVTIPGARHEILMENNVIRDRFWREFDTFANTHCS